MVSFRCYQDRLPRLKRAVHSNRMPTACHSTAQGRRASGAPWVNGSRIMHSEGEPQTGALVRPLQGRFMFVPVHPGCRFRSRCDRRSNLGCGVACLWHAAVGYLCFVQQHKLGTAERGGRAKDLPTKAALRRGRIHPRRPVPGTPVGYRGWMWPRSYRRCNGTLTARPLFLSCGRKPVLKARA